MTITDEKLSAYIDGELALNEVALVNAALKSDGGLTARLEKLKKSDRLIAAAFSEIDNEPMPDAVMDLLHPDPEESMPANNENVVRFPVRQFVRLPQQWAPALAASAALAIGVGIGMQFTANNNAQQYNSILAAGVIDESSPVHQALENTLSSRTYSFDGASIAPVFTFKSVDGDYCREFTATAGASANRAVACRKDGQWEVQFALRIPLQPSDPATYSTASGANLQFDIFVDDIMDGSGLDVDEERALLNTW